jgi:hypothetical protein
MLRETTTNNKSFTTQQTVNKEQYARLLQKNKAHACEIVSENHALHCIALSLSIKHSLSYIKRTENINRGERREEQETASRGAMLGLSFGASTSRIAKVEQIKVLIDMVLRCIYARRLRVASVA